MIMGRYSIWEVVAVSFFVLLFGAFIFWLNAWLLMLLWNLLSPLFHGPQIRWIHAAGFLVLLGLIKGALIVKEKKS
jgi:hypothetical protein